MQKKNRAMAGINLIKRGKFREDTNMIYAPMMIPTLCRANHFIRCIESLKRNLWAQYTDVYIALDYPAKKEHWRGHQQICKYLEVSDFSCFASFNIIRRDVNYGSSRNSSDLREYLFRNYDCIIRTDDDVEFSPNFLEYMNKALEQFKNDDRVIAVSGYSYPVQWDIDEKSNTMLENFVAPMWGTGFWREKFRYLQEYLERGGLVIDFEKTLTSKKYKKLTKAGWCDYAFSITGRHPYDTMICRMADVSMRIYLAVKDKYIVSPAISKSRNWGFDGSGVYCQNIIGNRKGNCARNYLYAKQPIDDEETFEISLDTKNAFAENRKRLDTFDKRSIGEIMKADCRVILYMVLGKSYKKLITWLGG